MADRPTLRAAALGKTFAGREAALRDITLEIAGGEFVSLVGPSGCGKSTLLRLVAGLLEPSTGTLTVGGVTSEQARRGAHRLAFVFQEPTLLPWRTVQDNICLPMELQGIGRTEQLKAAERALQLIGLLPDDLGKFPRMLSGGMRMRVSLARALVTQPDILLLDEPFAALHDLLRQQLNEELLRLWSELRWTTLFVTHNVSEAVFLSQRILILSSRPGTIAAEVTVPFPPLRTAELRASAEFAALTGEVSRLLRRASG